MVTEPKIMVKTDEGEPESFEEAKGDTHSRKWLSAMQEEMDSLHENHTYELVELPKGKMDSLHEMNSIEVRSNSHFSLLA